MCAGYHREWTVSSFSRIVRQVHQGHRNTAPIFSSPVLCACGEVARNVISYLYLSPQHMAEMCLFL